MSPTVSFQIRPGCSGQIASILAEAGMRFELECEGEVSQLYWPKRLKSRHLNFYTGKLHTPRGRRWAQIQNDGEQSCLIVNLARSREQSADLLVLLDEIENALQPIIVRAHQDQ